MLKYLCVYSRLKRTESIMANMSNKKVISSYVPLPICVINRQGKVLSASDRINEVFIYDEIVDSDIFTLTGVKVAELFEAAVSEQYPIIKRNDKAFRLVTKLIDEDGEQLLSVLLMTSQLLKS